MSTLTKLVIGMMGQLRPSPPKGRSNRAIALPPAEREGGMPLMQALAQRRSGREFAADPLPRPRKRPVRPEQLGLPPRWQREPLGDDLRRPMPVEHAHRVERARRPCRQA